MYISLHISRDLEGKIERYPREIATGIFKGMATLDAFQDATLWYQKIDKTTLRGLPILRETGKLGKPGYYLQVSGAEIGTTSEDLIKAYDEKRGADHLHEYPGSTVTTIIRLVTQASPKDLEKLRKDPLFENIVTSSIFDTFERNPEGKALLEKRNIITRKQFISTMGYDLQYQFKFR